MPPPDVRSILRGKKKSIGLGLFAAIAVCVVPTAAHADVVDASSCSVSVTMPSTLVIQSTSTVFPATLSDPSSCLSYGSWSIVSGTVDSDSSISFDAPVTTDQVSFYTGRSGSHAGTYTAVAEYASSDDTYVDADGYEQDVTVQQQTSNAMVAKYASKLAWTSASRSASKVKLSVRATSWSPYAYEGFVAWKQATLQLQKRVGSTWKTVKTVTTDRRGAASIAIKAGHSAWRFTSVETKDTWGSTSSVKTR